MAGFNKVIMIGNLTRDPDYKQIGSGQAVCRLGIASNRQFKNRVSGELAQEVCYIDVDVWGAQAESCRKYLVKGRPVLVEGRIRLDQWEEANGQKRSKHSIIADSITFLGAGGQQAVETEQMTDLSVSRQNDRLEPQSPMEKEVLNQIEQIKTRNAQKAAATVKGAKVSSAKKSAASDGGADFSGGEVDLADEPPFQDDLPF